MGDTSEFYRINLSIYSFPEAKNNIGETEVSWPVRNQQVTSKLLQSVINYFKELNFYLKHEINWEFSP